MYSSTTTVPRPNMASPPQPPNALIQSAKIEKKRRTRRCSFDLRRGVLIHNAMKAHNQRKQERRKQREAAKVAQALEAIGGVKTSPSAVHCAETSPFLTPPPSPPSSPPLPNPLFGRLSENSPSSSSIPSSSNAKTSPTYLCADLLEMELELKHEEGDVIAKASANGVIVRTYSISLPLPPSQYPPSLRKNTPRLTNPSE